MFLTAATPPVPYDVSSLCPLDSRIVAMTARNRRIAYYYDAPDTSTFRYRVLNMIHSLEAWTDGETSASWFCKADLGSMDRFIDRADALVVCRARYTPVIDQMVARAHARRVPVIFDCDDLVFDPAYAPIVMSSVETPKDEAGLDFWHALMSRHSAVMRLCDRGTATNIFLANRMKMSAGFRVDVIPNFLHPTQQRLSSRLYQSKRDTGFTSDETITIGYFSGSATHNKDFAVAATELSKLMDEDSRIKLRAVGFLNLGDRLARHDSRIEFHPLQDPWNLQRLIGEVEINIAPLQQNVFTNCKSELKFFEAAITGTITVATPTYTFSRVIADGGTGFLAEAHEWGIKLRNAYDLVNCKLDYEGMAIRAFDLAERRYGWNRHGPRIVEVVLGTGSNSRTSCQKTARLT